MSVINSNNKIIEKEIEIKFNQLLEKLPNIIKKEEIKDNSDFFNLSVIDIYHNTLQTVIDIINDIMIVIDNADQSNYLKSILGIFMFNEQRFFYLGIILIILSFVIYFIDGATI